MAEPVLVHALTGFVDAGSAVRLAREHLETSFEHRVVATFDVDQLHDYRARRPMMTFDRDHFSSYDRPQLVLRRVLDATGTPFLLLTGPEPDVQWERFAAAVGQLVQRLGVRLSIGLNAIPMAVPHTRPLGVTLHGTRPELLGDHEPWLQSVQVPASIGNLLELRLGHSGHDAMGVAAHVPHYLAQTDYPLAAETLVQHVSRATGLVLPTASLHEAAEELRAGIDEQVAGSEDVREVVRALETQYDAYVGSRSRGGLLAAERAQLPSADELGAELEAFLAEQGEQPEG
ncbi:PAC2 family protein [Vallicoccus soli]|uniref:PAC2 family protein n=2 Tax=Vallicoccus soli TaxID=2339232 RepID=A0A3A3ZKR1_9ACTN|nr:PAC2 family protein [Vallicoccus soli]